MHTATTYLIRLGEVALKKKNRGRFVDDLVQILKPRIASIRGRLEVRHKLLMLHSDAPSEEVRQVFQTVLGIASISPIWKCSLDFGEIQNLAWDLMKSYANQSYSFAVRAKRPNKKFPMTSPEVERQIADHLFTKGLGLGVDLSNPDITLGITIDHRETWMWTQSWPGLGGLPVSSFNRHGLLLSGGIDSPVAGHMIQRRGGSLVAIYFHTPPYTVPAAEEKVIDLAQVLSHFQNGLDLHIVNFTQAMQAIRSECDPKYTVVLSRRLMMRVASQILKNEGAKSIITGESLGQVASQTIENISVIGHNLPFPILRPLIGMDKLEIIARAKQLHSYQISIRPFDDCCSLFSPQNPITKAILPIAEAEESKIEMDALIKHSVEATQKITLHYP